MLARNMVLVSLVASVAFAVGCSNEPGPSSRGEEAPAQQHDPTEPESTKKSDESNDVGADAPAKKMAQSSECAAWLDCVAEVMPETYAAALAAYGPDGSCWSSEAPASCTMECESAMVKAANEFPESARCGSADAPVE